MRKIGFTLLLTSALLTSAFAEAPTKPNGIVRGGCYRQHAQTHPVTFTPLQSSADSADKIRFSIDERDSLDSTTLTFAPPEGTVWPEDGDYWLRVESLDETVVAVVGVRAKFEDGKIVSSGQIFSLLLRQHSDLPRPLKIAVECSLTRYSPGSKEAEELGKCEPITVSFR